MMLHRIFISLMVATSLGLVYVHQRVALVTAGYEVESLRSEREDLLDQSQVLHYNVLTLRSPAILNERLAQKDIRLTLPQEVQILAPSQPHGVVGSGAGERKEVEPAWLRQAMKLAARWMENSRTAVAEPVQGE